MYVNASLLHELRMVITHATKLIRRTRGSNAAASGQVLLCVNCLKLRDFKPTPAVTITRGNAVCLSHLS